jgi:hypothetical protein
MHPLSPVPVPVLVLVLVLVLVFVPVLPDVNRESVQNFSFLFSFLFSFSFYLRPPNDPRQ